MADGRGIEQVQAFNMHYPAKRAVGRYRRSSEAPGNDAIDAALPPIPHRARIAEQGAEFAAAQPRLA